MAGARFEVEQRSVGNGDLASRTVDRESPSSIILETVRQSISRIRIQSRCRCDDCTVGGVLGDCRRGGCTGQSDVVEAGLCPGGRDNNSQCSSVRCGEA